MVETFRDVIRLWPSRPVMASDVGTTALVISAWWNRDSIPAAEFLNVVRAAEKREYADVTLEVLAQIAEKRRANDKQGGEAA